MIPVERIENNKSFYSANSLKLFFNSLIKVYTIHAYIRHCLTNICVQLRVSITISRVYIHSFDVLTTKFHIFFYTLPVRYTICRKYIELCFTSASIHLKTATFPTDIVNFRNLSYHYRYCCLSLEIHLRDLQQLRKYEKPNKNIA